MSRIFNAIGVVGGGAWGTALASVAARAGRAVLLWAREPEVARAINKTHENTVFLPGIALPDTLKATSEMAQLAACDALLIVAPAQALRAVTARLGDHIAPGVPHVICTKGLEQDTGKFMSQVLAETCPQAIPAILSGPSFAADVARGLPTAVTLASADEAMGEALARAISIPTFRLYYSDDVVGAQVGGALKNVLAIACGIAEGRALGASARAALTARGFAELQRFGMALGGRAETIAGLSGLGDLILTCNSAQSRNMSLGMALGQGGSLADVLGGRNSVSEGVYTARAAATIARDKGLDVPISTAVHAVLSGALSIDAAIEGLLARPIRAEQG